MKVSWGPVNFMNSVLAPVCRVLTLLQGVAKKNHPELFSTKTRCHAILHIEHEVVQKSTLDWYSDSGQYWLPWHRLRPRAAQRGRMGLHQERTKQGGARGFRCGC